MLGFDDQPLWVTLAVFTASAAVVWWAGSRLAGYADRFSTATGIGGAVVGLLLLGGITSLPEIATSVTAALTNQAPMAVNNLVGGVALQLVVLAVVDLAYGRRPLTSTVPRPDVMAQAAMNVMLLAIVVGAIAAGEVALFGVGLGSAAVVAAYGLCILTARSIDREAGWSPVGGAAITPEAAPEVMSEALPRLLALIAATGLAILAGGVLLTRSGETLAEQTGLGTSFFGAVFLAGATSLPELSSALAAVRLNRPQMAIGDVLGGNLFNLALLFLIDAVYAGGPVLGEVGALSMFAAALGILMSAVLLIGMVERRDRMVGRLGYDSAAILVLYAGGLAVMYALRP